jgi:hypothetical protein
MGIVVQMRCIRAQAQSSHCTPRPAGGIPGHMQHYTIEGNNSERLHCHYVIHQGQRAMQMENCAFCLHYVCRSLTGLGVSRHVKVRGKNTEENIEDRDFILNWKELEASVCLHFTGELWFLPLFLSESSTWSDLIERRVLRKFKACNRQEGK